MSEYIVELNSSAVSCGKFLLGTVYLDAEEITRCRDCRRYHPKEGEMLSCRFEYKDFVQWRSAEPDGFCAWGERRNA